ncbi:MAG: hypothetical protein PVG22_03230 [Chromatiales bacterium]
MAESRPVFNILPIGWDNPGWPGEFYPDDLPSEWRLTYLANEFPGVLVPHHIWSSVEIQTLHSWHHDVGSGFRFYLELNQEVDLQFWGEKSACLEDGFGGFVGDLSCLEPFYMQACRHDPELNVYTLFSKNCTVEDIQQHALDKRRIAFLYSATDLGDLKNQRGLLEELADQVAPTAEVLLFLEGGPPVIERLRDLRILAKMLGLA